MNALPNTDMPAPLLVQGKLITSRLFEAYLACPTKCYLQSIGEDATRNDFTIWQEARIKSYRFRGIQWLEGEFPRSLEVGLRDLAHWTHASWHFALGQIIRSQNLEADIHAVQRIPSEGTKQSRQLVPIRFVVANKLSRSDKLTAAFDAVVLSKVAGVKVGLVKIIHGDNCSTFTLKANTLSRVVNKTIGQVVALLDAPTSPDLTLNRHCPECEFQDHCRKRAVEKDDLSLLVNLPIKERIRLNGKGIFTVNQLSYTFRPRRRIKRLATKSEKYHHSLKALAIRQQKIHIVGTSHLKVEGTPVYLDVEGVPDCDFYYLIGVRLETDAGVTRHSLWADTVADEKPMWSSFLDILSAIDHPVLIHYGSYETTFLKRMCDRYGKPSDDSGPAKAIASSVNLLSTIFAQVYFPTYSNGLKDIARFLGFAWTHPSSSGLQSIAWRHEWELSRDPALRETLITYNAEDCEALNLVANALGQISQADKDNNKVAGTKSEIVHVESLGKSLNSKWRIFKSPLPDLEKINDAAHWDYQRDRVFVRSGIHKTLKSKIKSKTHRVVKKIEKIVVLKAPTSCPDCGKRSRRKVRLVIRTAQDLVFGRDSVKRRLVKYVAQSYLCRSCGCEYGMHEWLRYGRKWGWHLLAYFIYHVIDLRVPQLTVQHNLNRLFGFNLGRSTLNNFKMEAANYYRVTKRKILQRIIQGNLIHADETRANIKGHLAYVWVLTNLKEVVYIVAESREGAFIRDLLREFKGVLVSDFYSAYDAIECPQQKCLIHLMRDLNDDLLNNPFDDEMKAIATEFAGLLKPIVETIDRRGLKKYFLRKYLVKVNQFYGFLAESEFRSEVATKYKVRFQKNRDKLFTFLLYDDVPWNNNNAEHAIKAFARLRDVISGMSTKKGVDEYLTLLSVAETCEYQKIDFLNFLRSGGKDIETFARGHSRYAKRKTVVSSK